MELKLVLYHSDRDLFDDKEVVIPGKVFAVVEVNDGTTWHPKTAIKAMDGKMYSIPTDEVRAFIDRKIMREATEDETALFMLNDPFGEWKT